MRFKPTILKLIVSIVVGIVIGLIFGSRYSYCREDGLCIDGAFSAPSFVIITFISILIIYSVWSLIQKKK